MTTFNQLQYKRPDIDTIQKDFNVLCDQIEKANNLEEVLILIDKVGILKNQFATAYNISHIRYTINTKDKFYEGENDFFNKNFPLFEALTNRYYSILNKNKFRKQLEKKLGSQFFVISELAEKTFKPEIIEDLQLENQLSSEYTKLKAKAKIKYKGNTYNLSNILPLETDPDRKVRKSASIKKWQFFENNEEQLGEIFDKLVKVRTKIAQKLGYKNFVELGYIRMMRSDYNAEMVEVFRNEVKEHIVPLSQKLYDRQRKRLKLRKLYFYDQEFKYNTGNPSPKGTEQEIVQSAKKMYQELSPDTEEFFNYMLDSEMLDLTSRDGKATGGYCTFIADYKSPFIFANFNGTSGDVDVLTHEAGHAFQVYSSRNIELDEYYWPTYEACEIHSMSMEFFTWPWMNLFFKEDTDKYYFSHLSAALQFLPYGVAVDEFQHIIYSNPDMTHEQRNEVWKSLEEKYIPNKDYNGYEFLEKGTFWLKQNHIFNSPFYYIDYTLAQMCAFQFWVKNNDNHENAWKDYVTLCKAGGSKSFLELVKIAKLKSPFEPGIMKKIIKPISKWLKSIDDKQF
jgi:M3 family oligoendopeptidase